MITRAADSDTANLLVYVQTEALYFDNVKGGCTQISSQQQQGILSE